MKLHYCNFSRLNLPVKSNVGDDLNEVIFPHFLECILNSDENWLFSGIGTILDSIPSHKKSVIFGSGFRYGSPKPSISHSSKRLSVAKLLREERMSID